MAGRPAGWLAGWLAAALESPKGGTTGLAATAWLCQIIKVSKGAKASRGNTRETGGNKQASCTRSGDDSRSPRLIGPTIFRPAENGDDFLREVQVSCELRGRETRRRTRSDRGIAPSRDRGLTIILAVNRIQEETRS